MNIIKTIKEKGIDKIWVSKSFSHFMLLKNVSAYDDLITTLWHPKEAVHINLKGIIEILMEDPTNINYAKIHCLDSDFIAIFDFVAEASTFPKIKLDKNYPYSNPHNELRLVCLLKKIDNYVVAFSLEGLNISREINFDYLDHPYSFYITEIIGKRNSLRINCIYFLSKELTSIIEVPLRDLTLTDPEYTKQNNEHRFTFNNATLNITLIKMTDFQYNIKISYSNRYAYLNDEDFDSNATFNFMTNQWLDSKYSAEWHNLK